VSIATTDVVDSLMEDAVLPTLATLRSRGIDYRGVLYCGLMFTPDGPKVLEYNVRFGDPETQVVVPRFTSDLVDLLASAAAGSISESPTFDDGATVGVVCASQDYPRSPRTGDPIEGLDAVAAVEGVMVFNAGVGEVGGRLVTAGGRVLTVTGRGPTVTDAKERAYRAVAEISWPGMQQRTDIADAATSVATTG
jgi:phosphoribosylamine--glycine ligase